MDDVSAPRSTPKLVIVVDDDAAVRNSLKFALELEGFVVRAYDGGAAMLADRESLGGGCLVVDEFMPGMTGVELVNNLHHRSIGMPAILITAKPSAALSRRAALSGIQKVLEKPLEDGDLLRCIRRALRIASQQPSAGEGLRNIP